MPPVSHIDDLLCCASSTSVSLIIFSASFSVSFSPTFFHHVTLILCLNRASSSVSHHLVNAHCRCRQLGVDVRVTLLTCAELCSWLQLCSTARWLHSDPSLAGSLASFSRSAPAVPRQSSAPAGWSSRARETPAASCRAPSGVVVTAPLPCLTEDLSVLLFE